MKKKVFFLTDSSVNLRSVYQALKNHHDITWVYYHKKIKSELYELGCSEKNIIFLGNNSILFLIKKIINKIFGKFLNLKISFEKDMLDQINLIDQRFSPNLWITDTGSLLSKSKTKCPKATFKHSVTYKKYFLDENIFQYEYVFIPGDYHYDRILNRYPKKITELKKKLLISPSPKIYPFLNLKKDSYELKSFFKKLDLNEKNKTVVLAPTHDSFYDKRFLPKNFGDESEALKEICKTITDDFGYNFIIKLHHYHHDKLKNKLFNFLSSLKNVHIFKANKNYDSVDSEKIFFLADLVITDTSGVGPACCFLNKKIIYLNPDDHFDWDQLDIDKNLRPGFILDNITKLKNILLSYENDNQLYEKERLIFKDKIFKYQSLNDLSIISKQVENILNND